LTFTPLPPMSWLRRTNSLVRSIARLTTAASRSSNRSVLPIPTQVMPLSAPLGVGQLRLDLVRVLGPQLDAQQVRLLAVRQQRRQIPVGAPQVRHQAQRDRNIFGRRLRRPRRQRRQTHGGPGSRGGSEKLSAGK
jgi:hypothetical protein